MTGTQQNASLEERRQDVMEHHPPSVDPSLLQLVNDCGHPQTIIGSDVHHSPNPISNSVNVHDRFDRLHTTTGPSEHPETDYTHMDSGNIGEMGKGNHTDEEDGEIVE